MRRFDENKLLVEGEQDKRVLPYLLDAYILWGDSKSEWPAEIVAYNGVSDLLEDGEIQTQLKTPGLKALGIIIDANDSLESRWQAIRGRCLADFPNLSEELPPTGLIEQNADGLRLGVWIMPDNQSTGMLETFLSYLVPDGGSELWQHGVEYVQSAKQKGAAVRDAHLDKARIHSWLAIQDPPGESLHLAVLTRILDPSSQHAEPFVEWFTKLFSIDRR